MDAVISQIGVVGAGQMGRGIAQVAVQADYQVSLYDLSPEMLAKAMVFIRDQLTKGVQKNKWTALQAEQALARINPTAVLDSLRNCDLIIEAATENHKIKLEIFGQLDQMAKPEAVLATNTSSISITEIASATRRPQKVVGMHFMNPVPVMKLVEGICGAETSAESYAVMSEVAKKMGKTLVKVADFPGFAVNRILMPMINEAVFTLFEGVATKEDIDQAMKLGTNQPMGPLELADFIGLDTCLSILNVMFNGLGDPKYRPCPLLKQYVAANRLGRKNGRGFYEY